MTLQTPTTIQRWWIGSSSWELRHRTAYDAFGIGVHGIVHDSSDQEAIRSGFADDCDTWIQNLNAYAAYYGPGTVAWVGEVGIYDPVPSTSYHAQARAFDLTAIHFSDGSRFDSNVSWRAGAEGKRLYIAVAAMCRRYFGTVLTAWWGGGHDNHIHFDNQFGGGVLHEDDRDDTCIVQAAAVILNGESIAVDGAWGPATQDAYLRLINDFNMKCYDPKTNASHARTFLGLIAQHGFDNRAAGFYQASC
jgi:hypothetical protein